MPRKRGRPRSRNIIDEHKLSNVSEDYCFECKDGGELILCDFKNCSKAYHLECVGKDPTLPDTVKHWTCNWHICFICKRSSKYRCHCCTNAVCKGCIRAANFVPVSGEKGFCSNCLKLALLSEENLDVDSDGGKVDFEDRDTVEFLFKDYWEIIKVQEGLNLEILREANIKLKKTLNHSNTFVEGDEDYNMSDDMDEKWDDQHASMKEYGRSSMKRSKKKAKKIEFIGWGSKGLIQFLSSIYKDTSKPFSQYEVHDMIKAYINENQLVHPEKKKKVLCDERLKNLFGRKSVNKNKIYDLLEPHFAVNEDQSEDESSDDLEEESLKAQKRQRRVSVDGSAYKAKRVTEKPQSCFAEMTVKNIKLVYLKKSLIEDLLKTPDTFNNKVLGSFVRIKPDLRNFVQRSNYQIGQVTGVKNVDKQVFLQVRNVKKDVPISMLSDNDLTEEECEDLLKKMNDGILEKITIVELQEKAGSLHADITNHRIEEELALLENLIDQANEKGWRRDLFEYLERRALLKKPEERARLLQEVPVVTPETLPDPPEENSREHELKEMFHRESEALNVVGEEKRISSFSVIPNTAGDGGVSHLKGIMTESEGLVTSSTIVDLKEKELHKQVQDELRSKEEAISVIASEKIDENRSLELGGYKESLVAVTCAKNDKNQSAAERQIPLCEPIDIDDDNDGDDDDVVNEVVEDPRNCVWHYVDPFGDVQGPCSMEMLECWHSKNYFGPEFKVWKTGQSQEAAILLTKALALTFKKAKTFR